MDDGDDSYKPKFTRSRTGGCDAAQGIAADPSNLGCLRCRKGKHKCDEEKPICKRCSNVSKECVYPPAPMPKSRNKRKRPVEEPVEELIRQEQLVHSYEAAPFFLTPSDYLTLAFPDSQERDLFLHLNRCLEHSRGFSLESDALLLSLISIAAGHKSSLIAQQEKKYLDKYPPHRWDVLSLSNSEILTSFSASQTAQRAISDHFSTTSLSICKTTAAFRASGDGLTTEMSNLLLTSCLATIIAQCLNAGKLWKQAYDTACGLIDLRGGPAKMLQEAKAVGSAEVTRIRLLLENFVVVDVCQCLATGAAPSLMKESFALWWYDYVQEDADTVHNSYGVDRAVVEVANRVNMLVHEKSILGSILDKGYLEAHEQKVQNILQELNLWEASFLLQSDGNPRVVFGNRVLVNMLKVVVHVDLLRKKHSDIEVQESAWAAMTAFNEGKELDHGVGLLLAAIVTAKRAVARGVITRLRTTADYAYDVDEAAAMLDKLYRLRDDGKIDPSWRTVTNSGILIF
uniref:Zn(2)-C6 fungal-type domain-containing protein n=1 Tax=Kwoniella bestiolae CBS 10118 TaxID=1296100 RepID=A0A1B9G743_9TREE|nr:hypothetical protein I302_04526 [Kwoniella bestiolae CBS 10118]OCF26836.1 hypothetical protein I302_04526 [Kwoniella bestiolae CBS 10118]